MTHVIAYVFAYLYVCASAIKVPQVFIAIATGLVPYLHLQ